MSDKQVFAGPVCLIVSPSVFLLDERVFMSLGILKIAAVLEQRGIPVELLDLSGVENFEDVVKYHVSNSQSKIFGITATTAQMPAAEKISQAIKSINSESRIIIGGPHITLTNAAKKRETSMGTLGRATRSLESIANIFDVLVAGDGELAIFDAIAENPPKIIDADDPKTKLFLKNVDLDSLPFPARHLVDVSSYNYKIEGERALSIIAQLGCPFECGFCGGRLSPSLRRVRMRSIKSIVDEMTFLYKTYGVKAFMMYDDELNVNPQMVALMEAIYEAQNRLNVSWKLRGFVKAELFNERQARAMYRAGFRWILVGFESGSPRILENINKKSTRDDNTRCLKIARDNGLKVKALMSIGHPGESLETVEETKQWLLENRPDDFDITIITTYARTPYFDFAVRSENNQDVWVYTCKKNGDKLYSVEVDYNKVAGYYKGDPDDGYVSYVFTDYLTSEQIVESRDALERGVRHSLGIPFNPSSPAIRYEHSMGQMGKIPLNILRISNFT